MMKKTINIEELLAQFDGENAHKLGAAAGLSSDTAERLLERGVRGQLETLANLARSEGGQRQILENIDRLPRFGTVEGGLTEQGGAESLRIAGQILSPTLLGGDQGDQASQLSRIEGAPKEAIEALLNMSLPLLLSFLGERGLNRSTITEVMSGIRSGGLRPRTVGGSYVSRAEAEAKAAAEAKARAEAAKKANAQAEADKVNSAALKPTTPNMPAPTGPSTPSPSASASHTLAPKIEVPKIDTSKPEQAEAEETKAKQTKTEAPIAGSKPEQADGDYSKKDVVAALTDEKALAEAKAKAEAAAQQPAPTPAASTPIAPPMPAPVPAERTEPAEVAEPEYADDDYSKAGVVAALMGGVGAAALQLGAESKHGGAEHEKEETSLSAPSAAPLSPAARPEAATSGAPAAERPNDGAKAEADKPATSTPDVTKPAPSKPDTRALTEPTKPQPTAGAAAIAAAAAAAGVGAGIAAGKQAAQSQGTQSQATQSQATQGSAWKSAKPALTGTQPSQAVKTPAGPRAVPVQPQTTQPQTTQPQTTQPQTTPQPAQTKAVQATVAQAKGAGATAVGMAAAVGAGAVAAAAQAATPSFSQGGASELSAESLLETFRTQFSRPELAVLAESTGFSKADAMRAVRATVPVVLTAASQKAATEAGAKDLLALTEKHRRVTLEGGTLNTELLGRRAELGGLEVLGISELGQVVDNPAEVSGRLGTALGVSGEQAGRLLALMTPVVLGLLGSRVAAASPAKVSQVLGVLRPRLGELLPSGLGVMQALLGQKLYGAAPKEKATLLETKQAKATAPAAAAAAVTKPEDKVAPMTPAPKQPTTPPPPPASTGGEERSGGFPWWILPLLLLLGLGYYFYTQQSGTPAAVTDTTITGTTTPQATTDQEAVSEADVAEESSEVAADEETSTNTEATTDTEVSSAAEIEAAPGTTPEVVVPAEGALVLLSPADGESVPDTGFNMSGTGVADATYQLFEDGVSVGTFTADDTGAWQVDVAAPAAGEHTYAVRDADGNEVLSRAITVDVTDAAALTCDQSLSLSLNDGERVSAPFRFGGVGDASGYQVRVLRGGQEIGTKDIELAPNCTWNYLSQPGGEAGETANITYEVRSLDDLEAAPLQTITLDVLQAGE